MKNSPSSGVNYPNRDYIKLDEKKSRKTVDNWEFYHILWHLSTFWD